MVPFWLVGGPPILEPILVGKRKVVFLQGSVHFYVIWWEGKSWSKPIPPVNSWWANPVFESTFVI